MDKALDLAEKLTKELSDKVTEISNDESLDNNEKYVITQTYADIINLISEIVREQIPNAIVCWLENGDKVIYIAKENENDRE